MHYILIAFYININMRPKTPNAVYVCLFECDVAAAAARVKENVRVFVFIQCFRFKMELIFTKNTKFHSVWIWIFQVFLGKKAAYERACVGGGDAGVGVFCVAMQTYVFVDVHLIVSIVFFFFKFEFFFIWFCFVHVHTLNEIVCSFHGPFFTSKSSDLHLMPVSFAIKNVNLLQVI